MIVRVIDKIVFHMGNVNLIGSTFIFPGVYSQYVCKIHKQYFYEHVIYQSVHARHIQSDRILYVINTINII